MGFAASTCLQENIVFVFVLKVSCAPPLVPIALRPHTYTHAQGVMNRFNVDVGLYHSRTVNHDVLQNRPFYKLAHNLSSHPLISKGCQIRCFLLFDFNFKFPTKATPPRPVLASVIFRDSATSTRVALDIGKARPILLKPVLHM